jgi:uncharacterized protein
MVMTAEPRMEDLLASIRKAMDEDSATHGDGSREPGSLMRGALREMRTAFDSSENVREFKPQVEELRQRVSKSNAAAGFSSPPLPPIVATPVPQEDATPRTGFAKILAGIKSSPIAPPADAVPPFLRRTIVPDEHDEDHVSEAAPHTQDYAPYEDDGPSQSAAYDEERPYPATEYAPPLPPPVQRPPVAHPRPPRARPVPPERTLVSENTARASRRSFEDLAEALLARAPGERDLEDMTREMLRGMLRQWLDDNLPSIVEQLVREEIERVARRGH